MNHGMKESTNHSWPDTADVLNLADSNFSQSHSRIGVGVQTGDLSDYPECSFRNVREPFDFGKIEIDIENRSEKK